MDRIYTVLGAGRQGQACAYDLARFGGASEVRLLDQRGDVADAGAARLNELLSRVERAGCVRGGALDVRDGAAVADAMAGAHAVLSAVPYFLNVALAKAAIAARASFCDLGGNTEVVEQELALDAEARAAGVTITPDCGVAPGMAGTFAAYLIEAIARPRAVRMRCGGLPQRPQGPLGYMQVFAVEGLTNEYAGEAVVLREGKVARVPTLEEPEEIHVDGLGRLEACTTSGATSTLPQTYLGVLEELDYKTLRYPGHWDKVRLLRDLGFLDTTPRAIPASFGGEAARVAPRALLHAVLPERMSFPGERDLLVLRVECEGHDDAGRPVRRALQVLDRHDEATGFSAMERTTGFPAAIVCAHLAHGRAPKGAVPLEKAMPGARFLEELALRGIPVEETVTRALA